MRALKSVGAGLLLCWPTAAQTAQDGPRFEVASVKESHSDRPHWAMQGGPGTKDPGLFSCENITLGALLLAAFDLPRYRFSGPPWLTSVRFDVQAKVPEGAAKEDFSLMQQNLLIDRFHLTFHHDQREVEGYGLRAAKGGLRLKRSESPPVDSSGMRAVRPTGEKDADGFPVIPAEDLRPMAMGIDGDHWVERFRGGTMEQLATFLSSSLFQRPVHDDTGSSGRFDFTMKFIVNFGRRPEDEARPTIFDALGTLGLKLESVKVPVDVMVIDHIEKAPTEN